MSVPERSFGTVLEDILDNFQAIIRAEVRLAKSEAQKEMRAKGASAALLGLGIMAGMYAGLFLLLAAVYALSQKVPNWAAALIVAAALVVCALITISAGRERIKRTDSMHKTAPTLREARS
jgi:Putative Actinobacterial Holin-X, holin superfamily III